MHVKCSTSPNQLAEPALHSAGTPTMAQQSPKCPAIKLVLPQGEIRRIPSPPTFGALQDFVENHRRSSNQDREQEEELVLDCFQYVDEEGDTIQVTNDNEWQEALRHSANLACLKVFLREQVLEEEVVEGTQESGCDFLLVDIRTKPSPQDPPKKPEEGLGAVSVFPAPSLSYAGSSSAGTPSPYCSSWNSPNIRYFSNASNGPAYTSSDSGVSVYASPGPSPSPPYSTGHA